METAKGQVPKLEMMEVLRTVMGVAPLERLSQDTFELVERQVQEIRVLLVQQDFIQTLQSHHVFLHVEMAKEQDLKLAMMEELLTMMGVALHE